MLGRVVTERERARCLERLSNSTQDCVSVQREAIADLQRVLGFDRWCWPFADPKTLVPLSGVADHDYGPHLRRALELEFSGGDFATKNVLARRAYMAGSLSSETGGDLARSPRWDEVMRPVGIGDIAIVACRDPLGCWGWIEAYPLEGDDVGKLAVTIRAAAPPETFDLLCRAYALTRRERNVVAAVLGGLDTRAVAERLFISRHTVQDHLKAVFDKIGIHSRRELRTTFNAPAATE
jgi:DNA-binding CsgD family transcriptional regulator